MLLSYNELVKLVDDGVITNVEDGAINSASIDIHISDRILVESSHPGGELNLIDFAKRTPALMEEITINDGYNIYPEEFLLASTIEKFNLPAHISCEYKLKSSMARIGLEHLNAGWCDAGWHGSALTLELKNISQRQIIRIRPGDAIGQMVFFRHEPVPADRSYAARGRYNNDSTVQGIKK